MTSPKTARKWEFGDFQTPEDLAHAVVARIMSACDSPPPATIIEPTCGVGSLLLAAADAYPDAQRIVGVDINPDHLAVLEKTVRARPDADRFTLVRSDFFDLDWERLLAGLPRPFLVIGNPPWVTNADVGRLNGSNLPEKSNFGGRAGLAAMTGKSNFDISENMLLKALGWIGPESGRMAMLCKTSVARKVLKRAWRDGAAVSQCSVAGIDAMGHFGAAVDACLLCMSSGAAASPTCPVYGDLDADAPSSVIGCHDGTLLSDDDRFRANIDFLGGDSHYRWRSGVKHDCGRVMELKEADGKLVNGLGESVDIEDSCLFPLLKSSDVGNGRTERARLRMLVPQRRVGQPTEFLRETLPATWRYLEDHAGMLDGRRSAIYRNRPRFSVFGVGDYTFARWKIAISGFYKSLEFRLVGPQDGKPVVFDDTVYFIGVESQTEAEFLTGVLNSGPCRDFLESMVFWSDKRPVTAELLGRLDIGRVARRLGRHEEYRAHAAAGCRTAQAQPMLPLGRGMRDVERSAA